MGQNQYGFTVNKVYGRLNNLLDTPEAQDDKNRARLKREIRRVAKIEQSLKQKIKALSHREIASKFEHIEKHQVDRMAYKKIKMGAGNESNQRA